MKTVISCIQNRTDAGTPAEATALPVPNCRTALKAWSAFDWPDADDRTALYAKSACDWPNAPVLDVFIDVNVSVYLRRLEITSAAVFVHSTAFILI